MKKKRKLFCEYGPIFYKISLLKETLKKDLKDFKEELGREEFFEVCLDYNLNSNLDLFKELTQEEKNNIKKMMEVLGL